MEYVSYLIVPLLEAFEWFDEGLRNIRTSSGHPELSRPETMILLQLEHGNNRPSEIARTMGLSRQSVYATLRQMIGKGICQMVDHPGDRRVKIAIMTERGRALRREGREAMNCLTDYLSERIGPEHVRGLKAALTQDWGPPPMLTLRADAADQD